MCAAVDEGPARWKSTEPLHGAVVPDKYCISTAWVLKLVITV